MSLPMLTASLRSLSDDRRRQTAALAGIGLLVLCIMDLWQLVFAAAGAVMYAASHALAVNVPAPKNKGPAPGTSQKCASMMPPPPAAGMTRPRVPSGESRRPPLARTPTPPTPPPPPLQPMRQPSVRPVVAPTFSAVCFDAEVDELVLGMLPTAASDRLVGKLASQVEGFVTQLLPRAKVVAYAHSNLNCGAAFRVAVPEVEVVVCVYPETLATFAAPRNLRDLATHDHHKLIKASLRTLTDRLISTGPFKFRRSAFRSDEPKVTLHVPPEAGVAGDAIPMEVSINSVTPGFNAALVTECGQMETRAKELILLIKRWAKDRGACHAAKGHLSPYCWTLLAIYFLQAGFEGDGPLLPPLTEFEMCSALAGIRRPAQPSGKWVPPACTKSVGTLFKDFVNFYTRCFDFATEAVCIRTGERAPPCATCSTARFRGSDGAVAAVSIVDPLDSRRNLSDILSESGLIRMMEELARADRLCRAGARLGEVLEPWTPP
mmetsp:Transcript_3672/g.10201  ORF Transcript_3672/g.10201 Transcript_3672/m.10201 type:complete len:491 (+) Transcript_3672:85-1557(+)